MGLANKLLKKLEGNLDEKLIILNKDKRNGQMLFLAGGGASGKGFAIENFLDIQGKYKIFNVDDFKSRLVKLANLGKIAPELKGLNFKNPADTAKVHQYVKDNKLEDKLLNNFIKGIDPKKGIPNIAFDMVFKDLKDGEKKLKKFEGIGYEPKNTHLVWVLTNFKMAIKNNKQRSRTVPEDILLKAHNKAAMTMGEILKGGVPSFIDGEIYVILNNKNQTANWELPDGTKHKKVIKDFTRIKVKEVGKPINTKLANDTVFKWMKLNVPKDAAKDIKIG